VSNPGTAVTITTIVPTLEQREKTKSAHEKKKKKGINKLERIYIKSQDLVEREIEGEIIIVPLTSGIGDLEDELFSLNDVGRDVWARIDGRKPVSEIVNELEEIYEIQREKLTSDVLGFLGELEKRKLLVEKASCRST
jgi:hypothetical protein